MQIFGKISSTLRIARRLSCSYSSGRYTALVKTQIQAVQALQNATHLEGILNKDFHSSADATPGSIQPVTDEVHKVSNISEQNNYEGQLVPLSGVKLTAFNSNPIRVMLVSGGDLALEKGFITFLTPKWYNSEPTTYRDSWQEPQTDSHHENGKQTASLEKCNHCLALVPWQGQQSTKVDIGKLSKLLEIINQAFSKKTNTVSTLIPSKHNAVVLYEGKPRKLAQSNLQGRTPMLLCSKNLSTQTSSSKPSTNPHIICVTQNGKGCISPGNSHLPIYTPENGSQLQGVSKRKGNGRKKLKNCTPACNGTKEVSTLERIVSCGQIMAKDKCKDDSCNPKPECPDVCKEEIEKLNKLKERKKWKKNEIPPDCISPKCKKDKGSKNKPSKKACGRNEAAIEAKDTCKKDNPCKKKKENPCKKQKKEKPKCNKDPCQDKKKKDPSKKKEDPCKKKESPCKKKEDPCKKKEDPCKKKEDPCKKKEDPCKKKEDPCKKKEDPCKKKEDPCKKKEDPCKKKEDPCKKKEDPCKKKEDPCKKKEDPCKKKEESSCEQKKKSPCKQKSDKKQNSPCAESKKPTKPKCDKKSFSTYSRYNMPSIKPISKRSFSTFKVNKCLTFSNFGFNNRFYSSKSNKDRQESLKEDSRRSKCNELQEIKPSFRKSDPKARPKDGLKVCYPTYSNDCPTKFCKDPRTTACKKYAPDHKKSKPNKENNSPPYAFNDHQICSLLLSHFPYQANYKIIRNFMSTSYKSLAPPKCKYEEEEYDQNLKTDAKSQCNQILTIKNSNEIEMVPGAIPNFSEYDVLIRTQTVAISGSDIHIFEHGNNSCTGISLGHDATGIIEQIGTSIFGLRPGDRVVVESGLSCGICEFCKRGAYNMCMQLIYNGFFMKYQVHPADLCHKIPNGLSMEEAALTQTLALGCQACFKAHITPTSNVLIMGTSPTAVATALCARAIGAKNVLMICTMHAALELIRNTFNLDYLCYDTTIPMGEVLENIFCCYNDWPDVAINCAISEYTMNLGILALKPCGVCVLAECYTEGAAFNAMDVLMKNIRLIPSFRSTNMFPTALHLMGSGRASMVGMITGVYSWSNIERAFRKAQNESNSGFGKVIVQCAENTDYKGRKT